MFLFATAAVLSVALGQYQPMEQNNSGQPESPINNYATQINNPASRLTTIHFLESPDKEPYSVTISGTNISCMAPCSLQGPPGFVEMDFRSGEDVYMKTIPIVGSTVNLTYRDQGSALAGGLWLGVGAGLSSALTIGGALLIHDSKVYNENYTKGFYYHDDQKVDGIVMVTIGSIGLLTSVITGSILIHRYRTRVLQTDDQSIADTSSPLDSLQVALVPTRGGFAAGAGFQF